jgi:hypothetical protein
MFIFGLDKGEWNEVSKFYSLLVRFKNNPPFIANKRLKFVEQSAIDCGCDVAQPISKKIFLHLFDD